MSKSIDLDDANQALVLISGNPNVINVAAYNDVGRYSITLGEFALLARSEVVNTWEDPRVERYLASLGERASAETRLGERS